jgi:hypothetical protein
MFGLPVEVYSGLGIFLGCLARAILPFFRKQADAAEQGQSVKWEGKYTWTIIFAVFSSVVATMLIFPTMQIPAANIFPISFAFGWAAQDIVNNLMK